MDLKSMMVPVTLIALSAAAVYLIRLITASRIAKAINQHDEETYKKLLFSSITPVLLNSDQVLLMRANYLLTHGSIEKVEKCLLSIKPDKIHISEKLAYYEISAQAALQKKDAEAYQKIKEILQDEKVFPDAESTASLRQQMDITAKLYFGFDQSVIEDLICQERKAEGQAKGILLLTLAKAYRTAGNDEEAAVSLKKAEPLLKDTEYINIIESAAADLQKLDMIH